MESDSLDRYLTLLHGCIAYQIQRSDLSGVLRYDEFRSVKWAVTHLDINLVSTQNDRDVLADSLQVPVPVWYVLVGDTRGNIEHNDTTLTYSSLIHETRSKVKSGHVLTSDRETEGVNWQYE